MWSSTLSNPSGLSQITPPQTETLCPRPLGDSTELSGTSTTLDALFEIATLLETGLDRETLNICVQLCEAGVNPEALAAIIKELRIERGGGHSAPSG